MNVAFPSFDRNDASDWHKDCQNLEKDIAEILDPENELVRGTEALSLSKSNLQTRLQKLLVCQADKLSQKELRNKALSILTRGGRVTGRVALTEEDDFGLRSATMLHLAYLKLGPESKVFNALLNRDDININDTFREGYTFKARTVHHSNYEDYFENASLLHLAAAQGDVRTIAKLHATKKLEINKPASVIIHGDYFSEELKGEIELRAYRQGKAGQITTEIVGDLAIKIERKFTTALHIAAEVGSIEAVRLLIKLGANTTIKDSERRLYTDYVKRSTLFPTLEQLFKEKTFSETILKYCSVETLRLLRQTSQVFNAAVKHYCESRVPFSNKTHFVCAVVDSFHSSEISKISTKKALREGYRLYKNIKIEKKRAFLEVFSEKYFLFPNELREKIEPEGRIINPASRCWTPEVNDSWILGHLHRKNAFQLLADPDFLPNFWNKGEKRPTALGREIYQIWQAGYRAKRTHSFWKEGHHLNKFDQKGILLWHKKNVSQIALIQSAQGATKQNLKDILSKIKKAVGGRFETVEKATGKRTFCDAGHEMKRLWVWMEDLKRCTAVLKCESCHSTSKI